jgi:quercetin dioxygenase-like cupin family protein
MDIPVLSWKDAFDGMPSEQAIRDHYELERHRVSKFEYPKGTKFPGEMKAGTCFVIEGRCCYSFNNFTIQLKSGEYVGLPEGAYEFETIGDASVVIVLVWKI